MSAAEALQKAVYGALLDPAGPAGAAGLDVYDEVPEPMPSRRLR